MTASSPTPDTVLRLCAASDPDPWFPSKYVQETGTDRNSLDEPLNELRLAGLVRIGGWEAGRGQCYVLTDAGRAAIANGKAVRVDSIKPIEQLVENPRAHPRLTSWDRGEAVRRSVLTPGGAPVTWGILVALIVVFSAGLGLAVHRGIALNVYLENGLSPLLVRFAVSGPTVTAGQWWRLITYSAIHAGALHLLMNGIALIALGPLLERALGPLRFLVLWLLGALGGGVAVALGQTSAVGASGALCGLMTAAVAFIWLNRRHLGPAVTRDSMRRMSTGIILTALISFSPGVSGAGHLGGAIAGLLAGVLLTYHRFGTAEQRWAALLGLVLLPIAALVPLFEKGILHWPWSNDKPPAVVARPAITNEWEDFRKQVGTPTEQVRILAVKVGDNFINELRYEAPARRDQVKVAAAHVLLANLKNEQTKARGLVEKAGPYPSPDFEQARRAAEGYLAEALAVTNACDACFTRGDKWELFSESSEADETRFQRLLNSALEADLRWRTLAVRVIKAHDPAYHARR